MARATTRTLLPLDRFAELIGFSPILFNQVFVPDISGEEMAPVNSCSVPTMQYTWQPAGGGQPSRDEIANAIEQAEGMISSYLKFSPVPKWTVDENVQLIRTFPGAMVGGFGWGRWGASVYPYQIQVISQQKNVLYGGREAWSVISAGVAIVYSDPDGDGYSEKATVTVATSITNLDEFAVYYPGTTHDPAWEIRPITVSVSGGVATITFKRHQAVLSNLLEELNARAVDGLVGANFLTTVDVYRHYNDPSAMAIVEWSPPICSTDSAVSQIDAATAAFTPLDNRNGILGVNSAEWNSTTGEYDYTYPSWWRQPDRLRLWMRAGHVDNSLPRPLNNMDRRLEQAIAYLALSYMDREWQSCEQLQNLQAHWRADLAQNISSSGQSISFKFSTKMLDNPFGTTRAAVFAWRVVQRPGLAVGEAVIGG